jgi:hypothetical protein
MTFAWFILVIPVAIVALLAASIAFCLRGRRWIGALLIVGVPLAAYFAFGHAEPLPQKLARQTAQLGPPNSGEAIVWSSAFESNFLADVYPSSDAAAVALVDDAVARMGEWALEDIRPRVVFASEVDDSLAAHLASAGHIVSESARGSENEPLIPHSIQVRIISHVNRHDAEPSPRGVVAVTFRSDNRPITKTASFIEKPWVSDSNSSVFEMLIARSQRACVSRAEAESDALEQAAQKLAASVWDRMGDRGFDIGGDVNLIPQIAVYVQEENMIADRFSQRYRRSYGDLWRHAMLVEASTENIEELAVRCERYVSTQRASRRGLMLTPIALAAFVLFGYLGLNSVTKGYFARHLGLAAAAVWIFGWAVIMVR